MFFFRCSKTLMGMIEKSATDVNAIKLIFSSLILTCKIFRSLNAQVNCAFLVRLTNMAKLKIKLFKDFPEEFEDTMEIWMSHFLSLLTYDNALLYSQVNFI